MAAPKKKAPTKAKTTKAKPKSAAKSTAKPAPKPKTAPAKMEDPIQDTIALLKAFHINTQIALGLAIAFVVFQVFPEVRYNWLLNIPVAAAAGYLFWSQETKASGMEAKVCRWGLFAVVAVFLWRDIHISETLYDISQGNLKDIFSS